METANIPLAQTPAAPISRRNFFQR